MARHKGRTPGLRRQTPAVPRKLPTIMEASPNNPGLGKLEKLPAEIRDQIFELAIDVDKPISMRECCRAYSSDRYVPIRCYPHRISPCRRSSRFALLWTSREISAATRSIMHRKATVHLIAHPFLVRPKRTATQQNRDSIWVNVSYFRNIEISVAPDFVRRRLYLEYIPALHNFIHKVLSYRNGCASNLSGDDVRRRFTLHLGRIFDTALPFAANIADYAGSNTTFPPIYATEKLMDIVDMISEHDPIRLKITALTQLYPGDARRQYYLDSLREWFEDQGAVFEGSNPRLFVTLGNLGSTHIRFTS